MRRRIASGDCPPEVMSAEDPLFILYLRKYRKTQRVFTTAGYLLGAAMTHRYVFDYKDGDIYWCTADVGWVTGHSYIVYGPLANGAVTLMLRACLPICWPFLANHRQARSQHLLHRPHRATIAYGPWG